MADLPVYSVSPRAQCFDKRGNLRLVMNADYTQTSLTAQEIRSETQERKRNGVQKAKTATPTLACVPPTGDINQQRVQRRDLVTRQPCLDTSYTSKVTGAKLISMKRGRRRGAAFPEDPPSSTFSCKSRNGQPRGINTLTDTAICSITCLSAL
ncbi:hypothetical protein SKAU_G00042990 [Synaphobranchus kaupii]|uniref:Uncharacterized protein n=1 Tax=Synaphobranchus kaupii TaxID=118154 RepID=A0A9Q1G2I0_SYNKA|nr:hypothetical protein SKAU_G00042990 [Synaphobranchus kaupii]